MNSADPQPPPPSGGAGDAGGADGRRRGGGRRAAIVLTAIAAGLLAALATTRPWAQGIVVDPVLGRRFVAVTGGVVAPALLGLALAGSAAGLASATAGRIARVVAGLVAALAGVAVAVVSLGALADPTGALARGAAGAVGRSGRVPVAEVATTVWPGVATLAGGLLGLGGLAILVFGRGWSGLSGRYDKPAAAQASDPSAGGRATPAPSTRSAAARPGARRVSDWDRLSGGEDPTLTTDDDGPTAPPAHDRG